ncbi:unnamed protein product [Onchocerca ochengi]|uniref:ATP-dependent DNA helicase n=1 Tax=Onchocerca ochengi TaxID=42157 RepID=A0A182E6D4_ONCOC|nr:unnamed protein product [Onchocerca ochengi]
MPSPNRSAVASLDVELRHVPERKGTKFLLRLILATIPSQNDVALSLASSGIAAALLPDGITAHSALKLPLSMQLIGTPPHNISKTSGMEKANIACNSSIDASGKNKCLPEISYFVTTRKKIDINYNSPAAKMIDQLGSSHISSWKLERKATS